MKRQLKAVIKAVEFMYRNLQDDATPLFEKVSWNAGVLGLQAWAIPQHMSMHETSSIAHGHS